MSEDKLQNIVQALQELLEDKSVPKNVKQRIENSISFLKTQGEISLKVNRALSELDQVSDDSNMQPYTRTQIWNIVSLLEMM
ncbi:UPF0147 family protein [Candidatus Woesearchaeota archaeon]|nr:UPF0147 family protein [Candidatus Woesearchaeota archaeon]